MSNEAATTDQPNQSIRSPSADIFIGTMIFVPSLILFILSLPVTWVFMRSPSFNKSSCFQLMISLSISDCINLIGWMIIGSNMFLHGDVFNDTFFTAVLVANFGGWRNLSWHQAILAVNRYVATCHETKYPILFSPNRLRVLIAIAWIHSIVWACMAFIEPHVKFQMDGYYEDFPNPTMAKFYMIEDSVCSGLCLLVCTGCYIAILFKFRKIQKLVADSQIEQTKGSENGESRKQYRLALQLFLGSVLFAANAIGFYMVMGMAMNEWVAFFISTYTGVLNNGISVVIYLVFNKELRNEIGKRFFSR